MREKWARRVAVLTGCLVVILAVVFAARQNPLRPKPMPDSAARPVVPANGQKPPMLSKPAEKPVEPAIPRQRAPAPSMIQVGQEVYVDQACARCHSIAGRGSPRSPLDGVGSRLGEAEIRAWVTPSTALQGFQARHANIGLTNAQRDALVVFLLSLR